MIRYCTSTILSLYLEPCAIDSSTLSWTGPRLVELPSLFRRPLWLLYLLVPGAPRFLSRFRS